MSYITDTTEGAIARSVSHNEIVTVQTDDASSAYDALMADPLSGDDTDHVDASQTLREVWGTTPAGDEWRVHICQREEASDDPESL